MHKKLYNTLKVPSFTFISEMSKMFVFGSLQTSKSIWPHLQFLTTCMYLYSTLVHEVLGKANRIVSTLCPICQVCLELIDYFNNMVCASCGSWWSVCAE